MICGRHYNDIDHITPVVYKWSRSGYRCTVILIGFADVSNDYRIQFLSMLACVRVIDIRVLLTGTDYIQFRLINLVLYGHSSQYLNRQCYQLLEILWPVGRRRQFWNKVAEKLLKTAFAHNSEGVVVFDWISQKSVLPLEFVRHVLAIYRARGDVSISLPHGDSPHFNELIRNHDFRIEPQIKYAHSDMFDYIVCPNELCAKRYRPFINGTKIKVLGSARYSDEWLGILSKLLPLPAIRMNFRCFGRKYAVSL
ncbi:hypothetical protein SAMN05216302_101096 [Nitrosomonas aestuarii]|uniref:Uncharacterized protein n=1 Tax=Nitrosomonas aestuarii TaxID=52441 RepID=A0A1I4B0A3_9PROT|nr:hypothetical protein [Nitrosomonas aestuarii]SFK61511.1 hypothetical protein SAMN05216302_101096 [Nitrosomonas aestuarii]